MSTDSEQRIELYLPSEVFEDVNATSNIIQARTKLNAELDPLARFFTHAPDVKTLTIEQLPTPGEDGFPDTEVAARVLQFATDYRYLLLTERDRISAINKKAAHFFGRDMSQDELNELVPNSDESDYLDRAKWLKRVVEWALEHEDLFAKPYEPSKDEPSEDDPRWFSAYRIEFPSA
ncbi:hypothetical protein NW759_001091 [Fusarium solani]|nr:hypothetical protein NW759_001091 [Fusarium solani]